MDVNPSSSSARIRKHDGGWFDRMMPFLAGFIATKLGERNAYVRRVAEQEGLAANTTRRALGMLAFLAEQGVDLTTMRARPAIMSIEAVSKVARFNTVIASDLLRKLLAGEGTVASFRADADRIVANLGRGESSELEHVRLSDMAMANLPPSGEFSGVQFFDRPLMPTMVIDFWRYRLAVFAIKAQSPTAKLANAPLLIEGTVLRSVLICSKTVVCSEIALKELSSTERMIRGEFPGRLEIRRVSIENDITSAEQRSSFTEGLREMYRYRDI